MVEIRLISFVDLYICVKNCSSQFGNLLPVEAIWCAVYRNWGDWRDQVWHGGGLERWMCAVVADWRDQV